jgi:hypothetical protein
VKAFSRYFRASRYVLMPTSSTTHPASTFFLRHRVKDACRGEHNLAEVYATLTGMPGRWRVSGDEALLFPGNIRIDYFRIAETSAEAGLLSGRFTMPSWLTVR